MMERTILVVDDEDSLRRVTQLRLEQAGYHTVTAASGEEALRRMDQQPITLVLTDLRMPGMSGLDLLREVKQISPETAVIVITAYGTIESAVEAMKTGAFDYVIKPIQADALTLAVKRAFEHQALRQQVQHLQTALDRKYGFENITGSSKPLLETLDKAARAARAETTVLIQGETGTGKELLARAIHTNSSRRDAPFVVINCGAIPKDLLESELFGHTRGAFTGAVANKPGKVEMADGGTLFLDEIGELPLELQVKLLRLLQEREIEKLGSVQPVRVNVRIIAATHRNLEAMIEDGTFREDLFYRLAVIPLQLPPLRERPEDIPRLATIFFERFRQKTGRPELRLPGHLLERFALWRWPGNVRELENVMERIVVLAAHDEITVDDFPDFLRAEPSPLESIQLELPPQGIRLESIEKELILRALTRFNGNQTRAAQYLDLSRKTLIYRMEKFGLRPADPREEGDG